MVGGEGEELQYNKVNLFNTSVFQYQQAATGHDMLLSFASHFI